MAVVLGLLYTVTRRPNLSRCIRWWDSNSHATSTWGNHSNVVLGIETLRVGGAD